jgi:hypothetical protein
MTTAYHMNELNFSRAMIAADLPGMGKSDRSENSIRGWLHPNIHLQRRSKKTGNRRLCDATCHCYATSGCRAARVISLRSNSSSRCHPAASLTNPARKGFHQSVAAACQTRRRARASQPIEAGFQWLTRQNFPAAQEEVRCGGFRAPTFRFRPSDPPGISGGGCEFCGFQCC